MEAQIVQDNTSVPQMVHDNTTLEPRRHRRRLWLIFTCRDPALAVEARLALTLRMVSTGDPLPHGGLTVAERSPAPFW
jgi:predicted RNA polymerase sigma factor